MNCIGGYLKMNAGIVIGCLILLATQASVLGLCSTCLKKQCYENGECIIGCVPGYVGEYCKEECPSRCLNKVCHRDRIDGTVTCTDGCQDGNCGIQCSENCQKDCVTCDRKCGSCNVTLCDERRYGADCREICSAKYGKCDRETGQCIICRRGYYGDECNQECTACFTRAETIIDSCLSGCKICQSQETCPTGFYGEYCELRCSPGCADSRGCNRATRECSNGCVGGYVGLTCDYKCSEHCLSGKCDTATGECSDGCVSGYYGLTCDYKCSEHCLSGKCDTATGECSDGCVSGYHGLQCNNICNKLCVGGICNQQNGICTSGCVSGYISNLDMCKSSEGSETDMNLRLHIAQVWYNNRETRQARNGNLAADVNEPLLRYKKDTEVVHDFRGDVQMESDESFQVKRLRNRTKDEIEEMTDGMVRVSAVDIVLEKLSAGQRWITITGNAGDGKTTLGYLVLKEFLRKGAKVFAVYKPEEFDEIAKIKGERVIMFDDRFGAFLADEHLIKSWLNAIKQLWSFYDHDVRVIFVSGKNVVNESRKYLLQFTDKMFDPSCIVDLKERKVTEERLKILDYHLEHENVTLNHELREKIANKDIAHGFPHCCKMYSKLRSKGFDVDIEDFFESPLRFLDITTKVLYEVTCKALFQMMIKNDGQFDVYTVEDEDKRQKLLQVEKEQEGSYLTVWRNGTCQFAHPSVYESVLNVINENDPLHCVQYATLSVIRQKMIISESDEKDQLMSPCYIIVKPIPAVLKALAERFRENILKGDYSVFTHRLCQNREFCEALISCCVDTDEKERGSKRFINQPGEDGETMLWTSLKSGRLIAAQALIKTRADVNIQDEIGRTPLHYLFHLNTSAADAVVADDDDDGKEKHSVVMNITNLIIAEGKADVNIQDQNGQTPLHYLCQNNIYPTIKDKNQDRLGMGTVKLIVTEGRGDINIPDQYGHTPIHYLFKYNTVTKEDIQWIITEGKGDLNKCEQNKSTPLHYLCANSDLQLDTVDLVITKGKGDFNKGDEHGTTPLHFLCENGKVEFDVVLGIINTSKGDINKQDDNGITPLHVLCKGSLQTESILTLINEKTKADRHGNTPLHFLCKWREIVADRLQQLEQMADIDMRKPNAHGYTPLDYLTSPDDSLQWTDGMIDRSAADLVVCKFQQGESWTAVLGPEMTFSSERVHKLIQVEDFGRQLLNVRTCGNRERSGQFSWFYGSCSNPVLIPPQNVTTSSYWEINSRLTWREQKGYILLQIGLVEGSGNLDKDRTVCALLRSVCVSVTSFCKSHSNKLCIQIFRRDQEGDKSPQVGECVTQSLPKEGETITFTFGLVLDVRRGLVAFIDLKNKRVLQTVHKNFKQEVVPTFHVPAINETFATRMRLISGREIALSDWKINLIQQALSN